MNKNFDYKGLSEQTLEAMCHERYGIRNKLRDPHWVTEVYSIGQFLREYANVPMDIQLNCYCEHSVNYLTEVAPHEINNPTPFYLCSTKAQYNAYTKASEKKCFIIPSPLPWLRVEHKLEKNPLAKGTLAFFQHTTPELAFLNDAQAIANAYIDELLALPENMHPICVCLHMHDIHKGYHKIFIERSIPVYTAGNVFNNFFYKEFYDILLNFSYTTSQSFGSYTFYSVDANIPFYLYGKKQLYKNISDSNYSTSILGEVVEPVERKLEKLFSEFSPVITSKQKLVVDYFLGKNEAFVSRSRLRALLLSAFSKKTTP